MTQQHTNNHAEKDTNRLITDDYALSASRTAGTVLSRQKCYQNQV